jgi:carbon-monoxide dehydrogenase large subunit
MGQFGIGQAVTRIEDQRLLTGGGRYTDDLNLDGQAYAFVLRSPFAHAEIAGIDTSAATAADGVLLVLTGEDVAADDIDPMPCMVPITNIDGSERTNTYRPILAQERVRHVGQPVAVVVGETLHQARDAAELIEVDYNELPSATNTFGATQDGAPQLYDDAANNICFDWGTGDQEKTDAAFANASHVTTLELINNRVVVNSMEPRAATADHDTSSGRTTLYTSSQGTHWLRAAAASA